MKFLATALFLLAFASVQASERPEHYEGRESATLEAARINFALANAQLAVLLDQRELSLDDLAEVHELSYTMENALQKISAEVAQMAIELEEVHIASERADIETVRSQGRSYLERAQKLVP
jgi:hypothetical protein